MYNVYISESNSSESSESSDSSNNNFDESPRILNSFNLKGIAEHIKNGAKNIIVMVGAGISVSAGIPDFRTKGTGLYSKLETYGLPNPEAIFTLDFFKKNPAPFYTLAKEIFPGNHKPTQTHYFLKLLEEKKVLRRVYTQNIDSLERMAGINPELIIPAHGNFDSATCIKTGKKVDINEVKESIMAGENGWKKMNKKYGGLVKPDIVFFGENLPSRFFDNVESDFSKCDLLIVMGTSLKVNPFAHLIDKVNSDVPRLLINNEEVGVHNNYFPFTQKGFNFDEKYRDVLHLDTCDNGVKKLVNKLNWTI